MTEATTRPRAPRRSAEQLAAEAQSKANSYRAKVNKAKRAAETRQKVIIGSGLMGLAESGDTDAIRILERVKGKLTRPQDRAVFGLTPLTQSPIEVAEAAIHAAIVAHKAIPEKDQAARREAQLAWRKTVAAWERITGKLRFDNVKRQQYGFGDLGEVSPRKP